MAQEWQIIRTYLEANPEATDEATIAALAAMDPPVEVNAGQVKRQRDNIAKAAAESKVDEPDPATKSDGGPSSSAINYDEPNRSSVSEEISKRTPHVDNKTSGPSYTDVPKDTPKGGVFFPR